MSTFIPPAGILLGQIRSILRPAESMLDDGAVVLLNGSAEDQNLECRIFPLFESNSAAKGIKGEWLENLAKPKHLHDCAFSAGILEALKVDGKEKKFELSVRDQSGANRETFLIEKENTEYFVVKVSFLALPILFFVHGTREQANKEIIYTTYQKRLQDTLTQYIQLAAINAFQIAMTTDFRDELTLSTFFSSYVAKLILPFYYFKNLSLEVKKKYRIGLRLPFYHKKELELYCPFPNRMPEFEVPKRQRQQIWAELQMDILNFSHFLEAVYQNLRDHWQLSQENKGSVLLSGGLKQTLEKLHHLMQPLSSLSDKLPELTSTIDLLKKKADSSAGHTDLLSLNSIDPQEIQYAFMPLSTGWWIVFEGQLVQCDGNPGRGLEYIRRIIKNSSNRLSPHEFESTSIDVETKGTAIQILDTFQIVLDPQRYRQYPEDEAGLLTAIKKLQVSLQGHDLEGQILIMAELIYLAHHLGNHKRKYIVVLKKFKADLEELVFVLQQEYEPPEVKKVLAKAKILQAPPKSNEEIKKLRDRISKNIAYAIKKLNNPALQQHLKDAIEKGRSFRYRPDEEIEWFLGPDL